MEPAAPRRHRPWWLLPIGVLLALTLFGAIRSWSSLAGFGDEFLVEHGPESVLRFAARDALARGRLSIFERCASKLRGSGAESDRAALILDAVTDEPRAPELLSCLTLALAQTRDAPGRIAGFNVKDGVANSPGRPAVLKVIEGIVAHRARTGTWIHDRGRLLFAKRVSARNTSTYFSITAEPTALLSWIDHLVEQGYLRADDPALMAFGPRAPAPPRDPPLLGIELEQALEVAAVSPTGTASRGGLAPGDVIEGVVERYAGSTTVTGHVIFASGAGADTVEVVYSSQAQLLAGLRALRSRGNAAATVDCRDPKKRARHVAVHVPPDGDIGARFRPRLTASWVIPDWIAGRAGVQEGDVLRSIDGAPVGTEEEIGLALKGKKTAVLGVERGGVEMSFDLDLDPKKAGP